MRELDPRVPFYNVSRLSDHTKAATFQQKLAGDLLVVFGALALIWPASAATASCPTWSACGGAKSAFASPSVRRAAMCSAWSPAAARNDRHRPRDRSLLSVGVGMGLQSLLIGIEPTDPITYAGVIGVLSLVAAAACLLPARRAASVDPVTTLREE